VVFDDERAAIGYEFGNAVTVSWRYGLFVEEVARVVELDMRRSWKFL